MTANSGPPTNHPEPDRPDDEFLAQMLEEHPELIPTARAYLEGMDAVMDIIDQRLNTDEPEDS
jgi:hypothetical protein